MLEVFKLTAMIPFVVRFWKPEKNGLEAKTKYNLCQGMVDVGLDAPTPFHSAGQLLVILEDALKREVKK